MTVLRSIEEVKGFIDENEKCIIVCKTHDCRVCLSVEAKFNKDKEVYKDWCFANVYVDDLPLFRGDYSVFTVPTVLMFFNQKEIYRTSRFIEFDRIMYFVDAVG